MIALGGKTKKIKKSYLLAFGKLYIDIRDNFFFCMLYYATSKITKSLAKRIAIFLFYKDLTKLFFSSPKKAPVR